MTNKTSFVSETEWGPHSSYLIWKRNYFLLLMAKAHFWMFSIGLYENKNGPSVSLKLVELHYLYCRRKCRLIIVQCMIGIYRGTIQALIFQTH